jgi:hypothetical protein
MKRLKGYRGWRIGPMHRKFAARDESPAPPSRVTNQKHNADHIPGGAPTCSERFDPKSTVDTIKIAHRTHHPRSTNDSGDPPTRGTMNSNLRSLTLPTVPQGSRPARTENPMSADTVRRHSKPSFVVPLHRLLQICSTHRSTNSRRGRTQPSNTRFPVQHKLGPHSAPQPTARLAHATPPSPPRRRNLPIPSTWLTKCSSPARHTRSHVISKSRHGHTTCLHGPGDRSCRNRRQCSIRMARRR